jgi:membrane protein implicated in regulation of membrane protease activity
MFLARIDVTSDGVIFLFSVFVLAVVIAALMERASPRRQKRRRVDRLGNEQGGQLID